MFVMVVVVALSFEYCTVFHTGNTENPNSIMLQKIEGPVRVPTLRSSRKRIPYSHTLCQRRGRLFNQAAVATVVNNWYSTSLREGNFNSVGHAIRIVALMVVKSCRLEGRMNVDLEILRCRTLLEVRLID